MKTLLRLILLSILWFALSAADEAAKSKCPTNMIWMKCGTCEGTCEDQTPICTDECKKPGCYCPVKDGYVRFGYAGNCIHKSACPPPYTTPFPPTTRRCGRHEHWTECGGCDVFCENEDRACTLQCRRKCECDQGYVRGWDYRCIKKSECKPHPECAKKRCPPGQKCVWSPKYCVTTPCPQTKCVPIKKN